MIYLNIAVILLSASVVGILIMVNKNIERIIKIEEILEKNLKPRKK
jgi:uncharacterized integral membrane protein